MGTVTIERDRVGDLIGIRLKALRESRGWTTIELADRCNPKLSNSYISQLERGERRGKKPELIRNLAAVFGVEAAALTDPDYPFSLDASRHRPIDIASSIMLSITAYMPVYATVPKRGGGVEPIDWIADTRLKPAPQSAFALRTPGLSLEPDVMDGDTVVFDTSHEPQGGDVVVCLKGDKTLLKRYRVDGNGRWLEDNITRIPERDCPIYGVMTGKFQPRQR